MNKYNVIHNKIALNDVVLNKSVLLHGVWLINEQGPPKFMGDGHGHLIEASVLTSSMEVKQYWLEAIAVFPLHLLAVVPKIRASRGYL